MKKLQIAVIGPENASKELKKLAQEVGAALARRNIIVVTGGKGGVMEAAARGAKQVGGVTVGIISDAKRGKSNRFIDIEVLTGTLFKGLDEVLLPAMSDALILLGGEAGTLQEIATAYRNQKPIIAIRNTGGWADKLSNTYLDSRRLSKIVPAKNPSDAVSKAIRLAQHAPLSL